MAREAIYRITIVDVEYIAHRLAAELLMWGEPIPPFNTRYPEKLESCVAVPFQTYARKSLYKGVIQKASILFYLMVKNHPFQNGNKRVAVVTLLFFLEKNRREIYVGNKDLYEFARNVARSDSREKDNVLEMIKEFLKKHTRLTHTDENSI
jgi:death on curing protein